MLTILFSNTGLLALALIPIVLLQFFALMFIPSVLRSNGYVPGIGYAVYCYIAETVGILLMTFSAIPALYSVMDRIALPSATYTALLFVFGVGGLVFLWHDYAVHTIDSVSRAIPGTIHFYCWKLIGLVTIVLTALSFVMQLMFLQAGLTMSTGWAAHLVLILYGLVILWCTHMPKAHSKPFNKNAVQVSSPALAAKVHAPATHQVKKPGKKKK